ncbi:MAG: hypothetical protein WA581_07050, partial [Candidatus Acidiferrales bacterium]
VLNDAVRESVGEILLFSDASAMLERNSLRHLVSNFADSDVGAVAASTESNVRRRLRLDFRGTCTGNMKLG